MFKINVSSLINGILLIKMVRVKRKNTSELAQKAHMQLILRMRIVSSRALLTIHEFCGI